MAHGLRWTPEQLAKHPKRDSLLGTTSPPKKTTPSMPPPTAPVPEQAVPHIPDPDGVYEFNVPGPPMGKPRMTQRDQWKKRPAVLRYREYCDRIRATAKLNPAWDIFAIEVIAFVEMPKSWSKKKQARHNLRLMRQRPDWDNIGKSVCDALFEEDSILGGGMVWKFWCEEGSAKTQVCVLYFNEKNRDHLSCK
jgi:Holliday junction resolvase RusA-like endonuclease